MGLRLSILKNTHNKKFDSGLLPRRFTGQSKKKLVGAATLTLILGATLPVTASDNYDDLPSAERFKIMFGAFIIDRFDTTLRLDSRTVPIGTVIDLEDSFNVDASETVGRIDGFYRFNKRHRIDWTYYSSRRNGSSVVTQEFIIGDPDDPDGKDIIPVGAQVDTKWNFDLLKVGYAWSFLNKRQYEWYIGAGLNIHKLDIEIAYQATAGSTIDRDRYDAAANIPLPTATIGGRYRMSKKWQANVRYELFFLEFDNYKGARQEFMLTFEHNTFKNVGFGVGLNMIDMDVQAKTDEFRGQFDSNLLGLVGYIKVYF